MARLVTDARSLSATLPAEELDGRALTALKGLIAAAVALPEHAGLLDPRAPIPAAGNRPPGAARRLPRRAQPGRAARRPAGPHRNPRPAAGAQRQPPPALTTAIERMAPALRALRHGDGGLALFNGSKEETPRP